MRDNADTGASTPSSLLSQRDFPDNECWRHHRTQCGEQALVAVIFVLEPLFGPVSRIGGYTMGSAIDLITLWIRPRRGVVHSTPSTGGVASPTAVWTP